MLNFTILQAATPESGAAGGMGSMLLILVVMFFFMWFMGRGQRKQAKKEEEFRKNMQKGDRVIFSGGIHGKVHSVDATTVDIDVSNGIIVTVEKSMVTPAPESQNTAK